VGSAADIVAVADVPKEPDLVVRTTRRKEAEAAAAKLGHVQVTFPVDPTAGVWQVPAGPELRCSDTKVIDRGRVEARLTEWAAAAPWLVMPMTDCS
jgi:hypothetical protein